MAISITSYKEVYGIGKARTKKEIVKQGIQYLIPAADTSVNGIFMSQELVTGSSSDDTFGLRLVDIEVVATTDGAPGSQKYLGLGVVVATKAAESFNDIVHIGDREEIVDGVHSQGMILRNTAQDVYSMRREYDQEFSRILVGPRLYVNTGFSSQGVEDYEIGIRVRFEKVSVTKQEYLDKLLRDL